MKPKSESDSEGEWGSSRTTWNGHRNSDTQRNLQFKRTVHGIIKKKKNQGKWKYIKMLSNLFCTSIGLIGGFHAIYQMLLAGEIQIEVIRSPAWRIAMESLLSKL